MEEIYVIKVRHDGGLSRNFPSERKYSASTVGGLAAGHLALGATCVLLASLEWVIDPPLVMSAISGTFASATTSSLIAFVAGITGLLAWRRWYVDNYILFFLIASISSTITSAVCDCVALFVAINLGLPLHINIAVGVSLELVWSVLSTHVAVGGVRATFWQKDEKTAPMNPETIQGRDSIHNAVPDLLPRVGTMNRDERVQRFLESAKQCSSIASQNSSPKT